MPAKTRLPASSGFDALKWRCIGPSRGGRVVAVSGDPVNKMVFYFGACAGGIWKTVDGGVFWQCVSDGFMGSAAVGSIAVAPSDPNVIYAGTGETAIRLDVSYGDGLYKSTDAGKTWKKVDTLPPYTVLDAILEAYVEGDQGVADIVARGFDATTVKRVIAMVDRNEYKRRQGPIGIKITPRAFGKDWRLPIVNRFRE